MFADCSTDIDTTVGKLVGAFRQSGKRETDLALCLSLLLLGCQYDDLSDTGYIDDRDEIVAVVEVSLTDPTMACPDICSGASRIRLLLRC